MSDAPSSLSWPTLGYVDLFLEMAVGLGRDIKRRERLPLSVQNGFGDVFEEGLGLSRPIEASLSRTDRDGARWFHLTPGSESYITVPNNVIVRRNRLDAAVYLAARLEAEQHLNSRCLATLERYLPGMDPARGELLSLEDHWEHAQRRVAFNLEKHKGPLASLRAVAKDCVVFKRPPCDASSDIFVFVWVFTCGIAAACAAAWTARAALLKTGGWHAPAVLAIVAAGLISMAIFRHLERVLVATGWTTLAGVMTRHRVTAVTVVKKAVDPGADEQGGASDFRGVASTRLFDDFIKEAMGVLGFGALVCHRQPHVTGAVSVELCILD